MQNETTMSLLETQSSVSADTILIIKDFYHSLQHNSSQQLKYAMENGLKSVVQHMLEIGIHLSCENRQDLESLCAGMQQLGILKN
jgi:hypothetical protein